MGVYAALYPLDTSCLTELITTIKKGNLVHFPTTDTSISNFFIENKKQIQSYIQELNKDFQQLDVNFFEDKKDLTTIYPELCKYFENLVISYCVTQEEEFYIGKMRLKYQFIDKQATPYYHNKNSSLAYELLKKLDGPCFWTHNSGGYHEGIRAWLSTYEVALLLEDFDQVNVDLETKTAQQQSRNLRNFLEKIVVNKKGLLNGGDLRF